MVFEFVILYKKIRMTVHECNVFKFTFIIYLFKVLILHKCISSKRNFSIMYVIYFTNLCFERRTFVYVFVDWFATSNCHTIWLTSSSFVYKLEYFLRVVQLNICCLFDV